MESDRSGSVRNRFSFLLSSVTLALIVIVFLTCLAPSASALPILSGTWRGDRTETGTGTLGPSQQTAIFQEASPGGAVTGTLTTKYPGTTYQWTASVSGTISGSTMAFSYSITSSQMPAGHAACSESLTLTLTSSGTLVTAAVPSFHPCGNMAITVNAYTLTGKGFAGNNGEDGGCPGPDTPGVPPAPTAPSASPFCGDPIDVATGNVFETDTDYETTGPNKLSFTRYYNSDLPLSRLPSPIVYVFNNVPNVTTTFDRGLTLDTTGTVAVAYRPDGQQLTFNLVGGVWTPDSDKDMVLTGSGAGTWTLKTHDDTVETYTMTIPGGSPGYAQLNSIKLRNGYTQTLAYNGSNQLSTVTDSYSRTLTFTYTSGYLTQVTTPDSLVLSYGYSSSGVTPGVNDRLASVSYNTSPVTSQTFNYANASFPFALTSITDENGSAYKTWVYDTYGRAKSSQLGTGTTANITNITYNDSLGTVTEQNALTQKITYLMAAPQGTNKVQTMTRVASTSVPAGTMSYTYDANGFLASVTNWNGGTTNYTNNSHGDPTTIVEASGSAVARTTTIVYDTTFVHLPATIATTGLTTGFTYDTNGNPLTKTLTDTTTQTIPYSTNGQTRTTNYTWLNFLPHTVQTPNGNTTTFTFGTDGALTNVQNALSQNTAITSHTGGGLPLTVVDPNSVTTTLTYSPRNWLLTSSVTATGGPFTTTNTYDAAGNLTKVQKPDGSYLMNGYDTAHRLTSVADSFGNNIAYTLDPLGDRKTSNIRNPSNVVTRGHTATFDTLGRQLTDVGGVSETMTFTYDADGNILDLKQSPNTTFFVYTYDALDRWKQQFFVSGNVVLKSYDDHDRVLTVTDPLNNVTSYVYDGFGDVIQQASPDTGTTVYHYDSDGNLTQKVDALSVTANYTYDALDRMLTTSYPADATLNVSNTYDQTGTGFTFGIGRLTSLTDQAGSLTRAYDERGNLLTETRVSGTTTLVTSYSYDAASRVATITYPDTSLVTYTRDAMGRVTAVSDKPAGAGSATTLASSITYKPFGPWAGFTGGNSITETPTWDLSYRLTALTDTGTATVQHIGYGYNTNAQPSSYTDSLTSANSITGIGYNTLFRMNAFTNGGAKTIGNDVNGNRGTYPSTTYTYTPGSNQLATIVAGSTTTVSTNANGNITGFSPGFGTAAITSLAYSSANRLASVSNSGGTVGTYVYDAFGQRFSKTVGTNSTLFQYGQAGVLLAETTGGTATDYIYLNGRPLAMLTGSTFTWLHDDKLGRPQVATNASQTVVWKASYLPYGETLSTSGSFVQNLRFPGQYFDAESGFSQNRFRDYVPSLGRYLEADPIGLYDNANSINSGMNPYLYSGGDPMRFTDKTGLMPPIALPVGFPIGYPTEPIQVVRPWWYPDPIDENGPGYVSSIGFCAGFCDGFSLNDAGGFYSTPGWGCCGPSYSEEYVSNMHAYCEGRSAKLGVLFTFGGNQDSTAWGLQWPPAGFQETWGTPLRTPLPSSKKGGPIYYRP